MQTDDKGRILLVDDEAPVRRLLERTLRRNGFTCISAADAKAAREQLTDNPFDLMLSDIRMPGESGIDLCRFVQSAHPDIGVVLITGLDDMATAKEALAMDIYGYILKPMVVNQFLISVTNAMRRHRLEVRARHYREHLEEMVREKTNDLRAINEVLRKRELELGELNTTLTVLLRKIEQEKEAMEQRILGNIHQCVLPSLLRLRNSRLDKAQRFDLHVVETNLREVASSFGTRISSPHLNLTQTEVQVATLIRQGMSTKEIAAHMNLSINTIMSHRTHIREKLDLKSKKESLFTHLSAMD